MNPKAAIRLLRVTVGVMAGLHLISLGAVELLTREHKRQLAYKQATADYWERQFDRALMKMTPDQLRQQLDETQNDYEFRKIIKNNL